MVGGAPLRRDGSRFECARTILRISLVPQRVNWLEVIVEPDGDIVDVVSWRCLFQECTCKEVLIHGPKNGMWIDGVIEIDLRLLTYKTCTAWPTRPFQIRCIAIDSVLNALSPECSIGRRHGSASCRV